MRDEGAVQHMFAQSATCLARVAVQHGSGIIYKRNSKYLGCQPPFALAWGCYCMQQTCTWGMVESGVEVEGEEKGSSDVLQSCDINNIKIGRACNTCTDPHGCGIMDSWQLALRLHVGHKA